MVNSAEGPPPPPITHASDLHALVNRRFHKLCQMGAFISSIFSRLWGKQEYRIIIVGLDGAGKTTILNRLQTSETIATIPTIGFNVESVMIKNVKFQVWDLGGQTSIRPYWKCYYANTDGIVFVIDSADIERLIAAKSELSSMLQEEELKDVSLLILANKQDLEGAMSETELGIHIGLDDILKRPVKIQTATATTGTGLDTGFEWLVEAIKGKVKPNGA